MAETAEQIPLDSLQQSDYKLARAAGNTETISAEKLQSEKPAEPTGKEEFSDFKKTREEEELRKKRGGFQKKVDSLTKKYRTAEAERDTLRRDVESYKEKLARIEASNQQTESQEAASPEQPRRSQEQDDPRILSAREKFPDFDKIMASARGVRIDEAASKDLFESPLAAHVSYVIAKNPALAAELAKLPGPEQVKQIRRIETDIMDREPAAGALADRIVSETESKSELQALDAAAKKNPHLFRAIFPHLEELRDLSNAPEVYKKLAHDAALSKHISSLPRTKALVALGRISASLELKSSSGDEETPGRRAPVPIRPVAGGSTRAAVPLEKMSFSDFKKARERGRQS